jgi:HSP20 family molecular chaperone IbpA
LKVDLQKKGGFMRNAVKNNPADPAKRMLPWKEDNTLKFSGNDFITHVQINESKNAYMLFIYKPGLKAASLATHLTGNLLTINADPARFAGEAASEVANRRFSKCFSLPGNVNQNNIRISYKRDIVKALIYKRKVALKNA